MFRFTRKQSSGSHNQYLAKITHLVKSRYIEAVQDVVGVMAAYCDQRCTMVQQNVQTQTSEKSQYAAITPTKSCTASTYPLLTK